MKEREPRPGAGLWLGTGLVLVNLTWAAGYPLTAIALRDWPPALLTLVRLLIGALVLLPFARLPAGRRWDRPTLALAAGLGIIGFAVPIDLQTAGLAASSPALTAILVATEPLLTAVLAGAVLRQGLPPRRGLALGLALGGAWLIAGLPRPGHAGFLLGDLLLLASTVCFATYNVLSVRLTDRVPALAAAGATLWFGLAGMLPLWLLGGLALPAAVHPGPLAALGFVAVFGTGLAYAVWVAALGRVPAAAAGLYLYLQPVFGVLLSALLLGQRPGPSFYAGAILILVGVALGG